jgi:hypothetical protein
MHSAPARPRFQFTLSDLLWLSLAVGAAFGALFFTLMEDFVGSRPILASCPLCCAGPWPYCARTDVARIAALALSATLGAGLLALYLCWKWRLSGTGKALTMVTLPFAAWVLGLSQTNMYSYRNDSFVIAVCKTYAEAQEIYRRTDWNGDGVLEYATAINGNYSLFERVAGSGDLQLVDQYFANAEYDPVRGTVVAPRVGYIFRALTGQGPGAPGGRMSYLELGWDGKLHMTKGYALIACPYAYHSTGHYSYIINQSGTVYQKDLGPDSFEVFKRMTEFDPSSHGGWTPSE